MARPGSRHLASTIAMMLQLTHTSFQSALEARAVLEPALARGAAERITDESLKTLHDSLEAMREHIDDVDFFLAENERFHALVAEAAGNQVLSREAVCKEHGRIYQAIARPDSECAAAAMAVHIGNFATYLERNFPRVVAAPLRWDQVDL